MWVVGEGNGTPLQYSCLEDPMDRGAWYAAVHGVAESRTRLSDFTFTFLFSCTGEGNGNPLQYSCLENPRDGGAWWAAVYGVAQSRTRLKRLSSSSSSCIRMAELWQRPCGPYNQNTDPSSGLLWNKCVPLCLDVIFSLDLGPARLPNSVRTLLTRKKGKK